MKMNQQFKIMNHQFDAIDQRFLALKKLIYTIQLSDLATSLQALKLKAIQLSLLVLQS